MGQPIEVLETTVLGDAALLHTDRSITGQDGAVYSSPDEADGGLPGRLAAEIFAGADGVTHVFVASNQVVVGREDGWDEATLAAIGQIVADFFVFYATEAPSGAS